MKSVTIVLQSVMARKLAFSAIRLGVNLACSVSAFLAGDWKRGVYWISSTICIAMVSI
jgi:hypothetical protein